jgi:uncharacterized protein HemX
MPEDTQETVPHAKKRRPSTAAVALRFVAGALTLAAIVGGAGWLIQQNASRARRPQDRKK